MASVLVSVPSRASSVGDRASTAVKVKGREGVDLAGMEVELKDWSRYFYVVAGRVDWGRARSSTS
jgi:hypothetical protein